MRMKKRKRREGLLGHGLRLKKSDNHASTLEFILRRSFLNTPVLTTFPKPSKSFIFRLAVAPPMNLCHKTR